MKIETKYSFFETVILKHDFEKRERMITGVSLREGGVITYHLSSGVTESWHYEQELSYPEKKDNKAGFKQ